MDHDVQDYERNCGKSQRCKGRIIHNLKSELWNIKKEIKLPKRKWSVFVRKSGKYQAHNSLGFVQHNDDSFSYNPSTAHF